MDGILNINKATGMTSHDVVAKIRKIFKQKRVGHAGTLDPTASGVLPICIGQATRVSEYLSESGKAYEARIIFGTVTDTYDAEGTIIHTASTGDLTLPKIEQALQHFRGPQMQLPPRYSAIKIAGQPAYKRARAGEAITMEPRPITIYSLDVIKWEPPYLMLTIDCSKGTYIRSLAFDLGELLGCGAHLGALVRTRSGPFLLSESITLEQLAEDVAVDLQGGGKPTMETPVSETRSLNTPAQHPGAHYLYPADKALEQYPALVLDAANIERVHHGNAFRVEGETHIAQTGEYPPDIIPLLARVYDAAGQFFGIAEWDAEQRLWKPKKVFASSRA